MLKHHGGSWEQKNEPAATQKSILAVEFPLLCCLADGKRSEKNRTFSDFLIVLIFQCVEVSSKPHWRLTCKQRFVYFSAYCGCSLKKKRPVRFRCLCLTLKTNVTNIMHPWDACLYVFVCLCEFAPDCFAPLSTYNQCWWWEAINRPTIPLAGAA